MNEGKSNILEMKNILIVAYYFPPYAGVSTFRVTKFCKYLPHFGWRPWILTVDPGYYQDRILGEIPAEVNKIKINRVSLWKFGGAVTIIKLLFPVILIFFALRHKKHIDAIFLSGSPFHPFLSSIILQGLFGIPTVLDFRDSWSSNYGYEGRAPSGFIEKYIHKIFRLIERVSIHFAACVTFATDVLHEEYSRLIPYQRKKFHTLCNGYDPDDFIAVKPVKLFKNKTKTMILTGQFNIYTPEVVTGLMETLECFPQLHFIYVGNEYQLILDTARAAGCSSQVTVFPYLPYKKILTLIAGADYGLTTNGMVNGMGTKIFDYIALKKPTLCFVPKGSIISKHFAKTRGIIVREAPHTRESIKAGIRSLIETKSVLDINVIKEFSRKESTRLLAQLLEKTCRD